MLFKTGRETKYDFYSTGKPMYWPTDPKKVPDLIDFYIIKGLSDNYIKVDESGDLASDHSPAIMTISEILI